MIFVLFSIAFGKQIKREKFQAVKVGETFKLTEGCSISNEVYKYEILRLKSHGLFGEMNMYSQLSPTYQEEPQRTRNW